MHKRYRAPATPCDRLLADPRTSDTVRQRVEALRRTSIRCVSWPTCEPASRGLVGIADRVGLPAGTRDGGYERHRADRRVPGGAAHGLAAKRGPTDRAGEAETQARSQASGPAGRGHGRVAGLVRVRSVADWLRPAGAPPGSLPGSLPQQTSPHRAAPPEGLARRNRIVPGVRAAASNTRDDGWSGNIRLRQHAVVSGAIVNEAIRRITLIAAPHPAPIRPHHVTITASIKDRSMTPGHQAQPSSLITHPQ